MLSYAMISQCGDRTCNEDSAVCVERDGTYCFVVADGLGGHGKGEVASGKLVDVFKRAFESGPKENGAFLDAAFLKAQDEILAMQRAANQRSDMKTTAVALSILDGRCQWGHIGDSRLYLFQKNKIKTRTLDHSVPQMLVLSGEIREKQIRSHPDRNRLLRVVGVNWDAPQYVLSDECDLAACQAFLLCSDGFWEWIDEKKMRAFLKKSAAADLWLDQMMREVEKNGSGREMDNYTAIAVIC
jgi:serine/threonine protein phosphatase PrpC